ncbi:MAG: HAD family hydrolase [Rhodospirillaceae bacterium]|nr:HAD family hydrolase [Rhodospirillales bacterium]
MITAIAFDGDDTLWHNEPLFWASTQRFQQLLAPYSDPAALAERLTATEIANLGLFGYGIKGFVLSMIETAIQVSGGRVPNAVIQEFLDRGKDMLAHPVHLLDGVAEALAAVRARGVTVMLITKGDLFDQESKLARSGLAELLDVIEIVSEKDAATYGRLLTRHGIAPDQAGNSVRSDVLPMLEAGGWAVHVPYASTWVHEQADAPKDHPRYRPIGGMGELAGVLDAIA